MDLEEISKLCENLKLDDKDGPLVRIDKRVYEDGKNRMELCLISKIMAGRLVNRDALKHVLNR